MPENLDWTTIALVAFIVFVTIILLIIFCRWLRRDNEERAYRNEIERRRQGFYMVQDPANQGVWEVYTMEGDCREMQQLSPTPPTNVENGHFYKGPRRCSNPRAKRIGTKLEIITE